MSKATSCMRGGGLDQRQGLHAAAVILRHGAFVVADPAPARRRACRSSASPRWRRRPGPPRRACGSRRCRRRRAAARRPRSPPRSSRACWACTRGRWRSRRRPRASDSARRLRIRSISASRAGRSRRRPSRRRAAPCGRRARRCSPPAASVASARAYSPKLPKVHQLSSPSRSSGGGGALRSCASAPGCTPQLPHHHGGDALARLAAQAFRPAEHGAVVMGVRVDEAGRERLAGGDHLAVGAGGRQVAHRRRCGRR